MVQEKQKIESKSEELNLSIYFDKVFKLAKGSYKTGNSLIKLSLRKIWIVLLCIIFSVGISFINYKMSLPVYKSEMITQSNFLNNDYCYKLLGTIDELVREKNYVALSEKLFISERQAACIKSLSYRNFNPKFQKIFKDSIQMMVPFRVEVIVSDNSILDSLQLGIMNYLESNEFATIRKKIKEHQLMKMEGKLQYEQLKLDSLKTIIKESIIPRGSGSGLIYGQPINPVDVYKEAISFYEKELIIFEELTLLKNMELIEGFTEFNKPYSPKLWLNLLVGLFIGLFSGLFVAYLLERRSHKKIQAN
jgi:hypothetical protein